MGLLFCFYDRLTPCITQRWSLSRIFRSSLSVPPSLSHEKTHTSTHIHTHFHKHTHTHTCTDSTMITWYSQVEKANKLCLGQNPRKLLPLIHDKCFSRDLLAENSVFGQAIIVVVEFFFIG